MLISVSRGDPFNAGAHAEGWGAGNFEAEHLAEIITRYTWSPCLWRNGIRKTENFIGAELCALDFDGGKTIKEMDEQFNDSWNFYIIAPTRTHQKEKITDGKVHPPCDRFRLVAKFDRIITDPEHYREVMDDLIRRWGADVKCKDPARLFFPSLSVAVMAHGDGLEVKAKKPKASLLKSSLKKHAFNQFGIMPRWVRAFLDSGELVQSGGRNNTIHAAARALYDLGWSEAEIIAAIDHAPFNRADFTHEELARTVRQAKRYCRN